MAFTRFIARPFLLATSCLLLTGLAASSELVGAPLYTPSDIFLAGASGHEGSPSVLLGLPDLPDIIDFGWPESTPANVGSDSQGQLREAIFFTLLVGGILRFLMSDTARRFFQDTFDPLNWNSYQ